MIPIEVCYASEESLEIVKADLLMLPPFVSDIVQKNGTTVVIYGDNPSAVFKGYIEKDDMSSDGRYYAYCSHFNHYDGRIFIYEESLYSYEVMSVVLHEVGHAFDLALGLNTFYSMEDETIFKNGKPLDWYAALNNRERFATCFEAMFTHEDVECIDYCDHTMKDVFKYENEFFNFVQQFLIT